MKRKTLSLTLLGLVAFLAFLSALHIRGVDQFRAITDVKRSGAIVDMSGQRSLFSILVGNWSMPEYWDRVTSVRLNRDECVLSRTQPVKEIKNEFPSLCKLRSIEHIKFDNTGVKSTHLAFLADLANLRSLSLAGTTLHHAEFDAIGKLKQLTSVSLYGAAYDERHLELLLIGTLQDLSLSNTSLTDKGIASVAKLKSLRTLDLSATQISDLAITHLSKLHQLDELNLCETNVTDACVSDLINIPHLKVLDVCNTGITDHGLKQLREAKPELKIESGSLLISWR